MLRYHRNLEQNNEKFGLPISQLVKGPVTHYSIAVAKQGEVWLQVSEGERFDSSPRVIAVPANAIEADLPPLFQVGSVSKLLTGALIVKLMELGELNMSDPIKRFLPEWRMREVEVGHLLTHTSGIDYAAEGIQHPKKGDKVNYYIRLFNTAYAKNKPGKVIHYNTHVYSILAVVLERVAGQSLEQFAQEQLFRPLGMGDTTYDIAKVRDRIVCPLDAQSGEPDESILDQDMTGDTGLCTTASDLLRFGQLLLNGGRYEDQKLFSPEFTKMMFRDAAGGRGKTPIGWLKLGTPEEPFPITDFRQCFSDYHSSATIGHNGYTGCWFLSILIMQSLAPSLRIAKR